MYYVFKNGKICIKTSQYFETVSRTTVLREGFAAKIFAPKFKKNFILKEETLKIVFLFYYLIYRRISRIKSPLKNLKFNKNQIGDKGIYFSQNLKKF